MACFSVPFLLFPCFFLYCALILLLKALCASHFMVICCSPTQTKTKTLHKLSLLSYLLLLEPPCELPVPVTFLCQLITARNPSCRCFTADQLYCYITIAVSASFALFRESAQITFHCQKKMKEQWTNLDHPSSISIKWDTGKRDLISACVWRFLLPEDPPVTWLWYIRGQF